MIVVIIIARVNALVLSSNDSFRLRFAGLNVRLRLMDPSVFYPHAPAPSRQLLGVSPTVSPLALPTNSYTGVLLAFTAAVGVCL